MAKAHIDLSPVVAGVYKTANSYIVSKAGDYKFRAVKGNGTEAVGAESTVDPEGTPTTAVVLWETFGTDMAPQEGDLVKADVEYRDGYVYFSTADTYKEGNAVIAVKDGKGTDGTQDDVILWSWHIWLTDQPVGQTYYVYNSATETFLEEVAGVMMDRNLGATSADPGEVGALGLLYQWGRKDPFLGSSSISDETEAASTVTWPASVKSTSETGTIEYAVSHPTTFITYNSKNYDWYYTDTENTDDTRWTPSESVKSIYDPCPAGWRVPDGGTDGIWKKSGFDDTDYDDPSEGISFINSDLNLWYPAAGFRPFSDGFLFNVGTNGHCWSATPNGNFAYDLYFGYNSSVDPLSNNARADGFSVRCLQE